MNRSGMTIFLRELGAYFNSAIAYIFIIVFSLVTSFLYMSQFFLIGRADMRGFFGILPIILCVFLPAVTMRLWSEDQKGNTLELLLTFPMKPQALVLGKYFAALAFYLVSLASTLMIPIMLRVLGRPDIGAIAGGYVGALLMGALFLALGTLISGFCKDQIVSFILTVVACFSFYLIGLEFIAASIDGWILGLGSFLQNFFGMTQHFASFERGVISLPDLFYFLIGIIVFLTLNGFWIEGRMRPKARAIFASVVGVCILIFIVSNWLLEGLPFGRFDLTEGKIYTVSDASKRILEKLEAPVTMKLYISPQEKMPTGMKTVEQDILDKLDELRVVSSGKLNYKIIHIEAAEVAGAGEGEGAEKSEMEQTLQSKGIQPFQVRSVEADEVGVTLIYSALSVAYKEKPEELIPRIFPQNLPELEYLVLSKIYRLSLDKEPKLALMAPFEEKSVDPQLKALMSSLGQNMPDQYKEDTYKLIPEALAYAGYEADRITLTKNNNIPEGTKTLLIVAPESLSERQRYEIARFLRGGGSLFIAAQNYRFNYDTSSGRGIQIDSTKLEHGLDPLLEGWGLGLSKDFLMDEENEALNISGASSLGPFALSVPVRTPIHILIKEEGMNQNVSMTSRLSMMLYLWGSALNLNEQQLTDHALKFTKLLWSSSQSWQTPYHAGPLTVADFDSKRHSSSGKFPLSVMVEGTFPDPFEGKPAPAWPDDPAATDPSVEKTEPAPSPVTPQPGKLILTGCSTFLEESFFQGGGHLNFLLNSVDALTLGEELIQIRSKQPVDRTVPRISAPMKATWKVLVTFVSVVLFAALGFFRIILRHRSKQNYVKSLSSAV